MADTTSRPTHTNRLANETSPYLLQHAHNPVDWYPWGDEALQKAKADDRLILLSIGYSACHWCHVMERESFENESIAADMNEHYVNVKVDREERPDLDDIYMAATVAMNQGQGGWPMTVFLTPDLEPVFAGTYFPPEDGYGRIGFRRLLTEIARAWREDRANVVQGAADFVQHLRESRDTGPGLAVGEDEMRAALSGFGQDFDSRYGGFGSAPKFPPAVGLTLLLRLHRRFGDQSALDMVRATLDGMANGGMYDQVGGGFCRYSTDERWLVPHFEKMLYDNALLTRAYLEAYQVTADPFYRRIATEVLDYVMREMTSGDGGFYSATDADSEGEEGKFFVWSTEEVEAVLDRDDARLFNAYYDITSAGNWEGKNIPHVRREISAVAKQLDLDPDDAWHRLDRARAQVYDARLERVKPGLDDKVLTAWNGMMIGAFAEGYRVLGDARYFRAAGAGADFLLQALTRDDGGLFRTYRAGRAHLNAYLEDYAHLAEGLIDLYEAGGEPRYLFEARRLAERMVADFGDDGPFFNTAKDHEHLLLRYRDGSDGATPAPNAVAASVLARLSFHFERSDFREMAVLAIRAYGGKVSRYPRGFAKSLIVVDFLMEGPVELAVIGVRDGEGVEAIRAELAAHYLPNRIQAFGDPAESLPSELPLLQGKAMVDGHAALYVCRDFACAAPVTAPDDIAAALTSDARDHDGTRAISVSLPGAATSEGTARFVERHGFGGSVHDVGTSAAAYAGLGSTGLRVSRLGFGGYRVDDMSARHREALTRAIMSGVNLIDTSSNYTDGASERLVGSVINHLVKEEEVWRDELVVVTKVGYIQGANYQQAVAREKGDRAFPEVVKLGDGLWHCMHPTFLADQLQRSLDRLELNTIDVLLLHSPEYYLADADRRGVSLEDARVEFYGRVRRAFEYLEEQVAAGALCWYGVSSNTIGSPSHAADATSITRFIEAAELAAPGEHHFRVVQLPLNLLEPGAVFERNTGPDNDRTVLEVAEAAGIAVLVNRPLNAAGRSGLMRLAEVGEQDDVVDFKEQIRTVAELEKAFHEAIAPTLSAPQGAPEPSSYFDWAGQLEPLGAQSLTLEQWSQVAGQTQLGVARIARVLDRNLRGDIAQRWSSWRDRYFTELGRLLGELRRQAAERASRAVADVAAILDPLLPEDRRSESLSRKALWVVASTPGVTSVLNGMRAPDYVRDSLAVLEWTPHPSVREVYSAFATHDLG